jgi:hypothetical protein
LATAKSLHLPVNVPGLDNFVCPVEVRIFKWFRIWLVQPQFPQRGLEPVFAARSAGRKHIEYYMRIAKRFEHLTKD